ncbi:DUF2703 domain-containing protein [Clostridium sp. Cult3]|jgi:hypothetical protein|uniref:DUF2703 domain-containing protein n=1 Tax=Clostridium sp. Cult3 TaxID=2079004 RepID=UPI001F30E666|nr:DUF2703 domain-containing protein [Clostridium sp. Cult3]MCF6460879.1 ferredoxin [Clostridium sp. Cult3]
MDCRKSQNKSCECNTGCCGDVAEGQMEETRKIIIEFLYLDLDTCNRCQGTDDGLEAAITDVAKVLKLTGIDVVVKKIHIDSKGKAIKYKFVSSPTIRINGKDIQMEVKESYCESCGDLCGDDVDCRVWMYEGKEYDVPPKAMIVDAILRAVYGYTNATLDRGCNEETYELPENLRRFFESIETNRNPGDE